MAENTFVSGFENEASCASYEEPKSSSSTTTGGGTVIPNVDSTRQEEKTRSSKGPHKPILGILYSVSKTGFGEFWPLYMGENKIGRDEDNDVILNEGTVSAEHAVLTILKDEDEVYAAIKLTGGVNGVKLNGKNIRFDNKECKNMDIITIGKNYECLLILIDSEKLNLRPAKDFIVVAEKNSSPIKPRIIRKDIKDIKDIKDLKGRITNPDIVPTNLGIGDSRGTEGTR